MVHTYLNMGLKKDDYIESINAVNPNDYIEFDQEIYDLIKKLSTDNVLVLISNSPRKEVEEVLEKLKIKDFFRDIYSVQEQNISKPEPRLLSRILREYKYPASHAVSVGDNYHNDLEPAIQVGMKTVLISDEEHKDVSYTIKTIKELPVVLKKMFPS